MEMATPVVNGSDGVKDGSVFWMGNDTYKVPMAMHQEIRDKFVQRMRTAIAEKTGVEAHGIVLLQGGEQETRYCTDHDLLFRQESYFAYLFGVSEGGFYGAVNIETGVSTLFIPRLPEKYAVWMGKIEPPSYFKGKYEVDEAAYVDEMAGILGKTGGGEDERPTLYLLQGLNTDSGNMCEPAKFEGMEEFKADVDLLHPVLSECRVVKTQQELNLLRYVCRVSSEAHVEVMRKARPGMKEYELESLFQHHVYTRGGCRLCSYTCICATGHNSSVLHYGHAGAPNDRTIEDGDLALLDMGGEYHCYGADITCSFPVNGKFTEDQRVVYGGVLAAQKAVMAAMRPGVSWVDMHRLAERKILEALLKGGFLQGSVDEMMESHMGAVFMPHGLGHLLGLDTHDVGGFPKGVERPTGPGLQSLRTARALEEGMVLTVEPGCYFIEAVLAPALLDPATSRFLVADVIQRLRGSGGVRLEDDVIVTKDGCENMTKCPREVEDVEAVIAGAPWPPKETGNGSSA